jgi:hypothetical protein
MDNLELVRAFEALAVQTSCSIVINRLRELSQVEVSKMALATDPADMFRAQGRYQAINEISRWFDLDYLKDLKNYLQEKNK